jgi:hypothetical protein
MIVYGDEFFSEQLASRSSLHVKMDYSYAFVQIKLLQILGFLTSTTETNRGFTYIRNGIALCILLAGWTFWGLDFAESVANVIQDQRTGLLVKIFRNLPYCTMILRPLLVLSIVFFKRSSSKILVKAVNRFCRISLSVESIDRSTKLILWQRKSKAAFIFTATLMCSWFAWYIKCEIMSESEANFSDDNDISTVLMNIQTWPFFALWFILMLITFILSQQVFIILLCSASLMTETLKTVNDSIREMTGKFIKNSDERSWVELEKLMIYWKGMYWNVRNHCEEVNQYFNLILFVIYCTDFLTLLGFGAMILVPDRPEIQTYAFCSTSMVMFCLHITVFLIPLTSAHEEVSFYTISSKFASNETACFFQSSEISDNSQRLIDVTEERLLETAKVLFNQIFTQT